jgi:DNA-binding NarL/FixJ family response regulator
MIDIIIADDHPVVLIGTKGFLEQLGYTVTGAYLNGIEAYNQVLAKQPSIVLLDISMPGMSGIEITEKLIENKSRTKVVLLTLTNEMSVFNYAKELGVKGFLLKEFATAEIEKCLEEVQKGNTYFSPKLNEHLVLNNPGTANAALDKLTFAEKKILQLIAQQKSSKDIAASLFISEKTVETHRNHIIKKLNIPSGKNALLKWAIENKP